MDNGQALWFRAYFPMKNIGPLMFVILFACSERDSLRSEQSDAEANQVGSKRKNETNFNFHLQGIWFTEGSEGVAPNWIEFDTIDMSYSNWNDGELKSNSINGQFRIVEDSILEVRFAEYSDIEKHVFDSLSTYYMVLSPLDPNAGDLIFSRKRYEDPELLSYETLELEIEINDTIELQSNTLFLQEADSTYIKPYYEDQSVRNELTSKEGNSHKRARFIEEYLDSNKRFGEYFDSNDSTLILKLLNDSTVTLQKWDYLNDYGHNLEHFFKDKELFLIRIQYSEGNSWMFVNRSNGEITYLLGRPYFSPSNRYFVTIEFDMEAGYNMNGIEYFKYSPESISKIWQLNILNWGPTNVKWQNDTTLIVQRTYWQTNTGMKYVNDYSTLTISKQP